MSDKAKATFSLCNLSPNDYDIAFSVKFCTSDVCDFYIP